MDNILRKLYSGEFFPKEGISPEYEKIKENMEVMEKSHQKMIDALKEKHGEEIALQIDDDFMSAYAVILNEEMFNIFKEGFHLGFDIVIASLNKKSRD